RMMETARAGFVAEVAALIAGVLLIPTLLRVKGHLVLPAAKPALVYGETHGRLVDLSVKDGDWVKGPVYDADGVMIEPGDVIAKLSNPELQREQMARQEEQAVHMAWYHTLDYTPAPGNRSLAMVRLKQANDMEQVIDKISLQIADRTIHAPRDGYVMKVPKRETIGQHIKPGKPLCEVADPHRLEARLILDQSDVDLIRVDRQAWIKIYGTSEMTFRGQ